MFDGPDPIYPQIAEQIRQDVNEGALYRTRGLGTYVAGYARQRLLQERRRQFLAEVLEPVIDGVLGVAEPGQGLTARGDDSGTVPTRRR